MYISSVNNDKVKNLVKLKDKKYRDSNGLFFVEGIDLVNEAIKNNCVVELYLLEGTINNFNMECTYVSNNVMKKISSMESVSNYYAVCKKLDNNNIGNRVIILEDLQDPGNIGTIIRSAKAFNFDTIVLSYGCCDLYNPKTVRSTKGLLFNSNILIRDVYDFVSKMEGYTIYGTSVVNGIDVCDIDKSDKICIVIGNEGKGISDRMTKLCNKFMYIKMNSECESLNAGVAASILMYEVNK